MMLSMQVRRRFPMAFAIAACVAGCSADPATEGMGETRSDTLRGEPPVAAGGSPQPADGVSQPGPTVRETIHIEGMPEEIDARHYEAPEGFPLPFSTIVPADMAVETDWTGDTSAISIEAEFGGVRRPDARLSIVVLPAGTDEEQAVERAAAVVDSLGGYETERGSTPWAARTYRLTGSHAGFLGLGEREDRWFHILLAYPPEFGDGMGPRVDLILRRWSWNDGSGLIDNGAH